MTQATDQDIREIKSSIDANSRAIDTLVKGTEANTKAIADLVASVGGLREEMRVGFSNRPVRKFAAHTVTGVESNLKFTHSSQI